MTISGAPSSKRIAISIVPIGPGDVIAGKFRVERTLGQGGMGIVVEATNTLLDERVAIKLLRPDADRAPDVIDRFAREARAAVKLRSEHVARVSDVGTDDKHGPYMVMELLEGTSLYDMLATSGPLPVQRVVEYVINACEGLAEAHARGIVHRDVKPGNLFVVRGSHGHPCAKVLDFGISKATLTSAPIAETSTGGGARQLGSPHYFSPEQVRSAADVDHRADIWALGCVLFELITGQKAFSAVRFTELVAKILEAPRAAVPAGIDFPPGVLEVVDRCLAKDREKRYASTGELALALLPFARRRSHSIVGRAVAHVRDAGIDPRLTMPSTMPPPPSDRSLELASAHSLRMPAVPVFATTDTTSPVETSALPSSSPGVAEEKKRRGMVPYAIGIAAAAVLVTAGFMGLKKDAPPASAAGGARSTATPTAAAPTTTAPTTTTAERESTTEAAADAGAAGTPPTRPPTRPGIRYTWPPPKPAASPSPNPAGASPDGEIRHTR